MVELGPVEKVYQFPEQLCPLNYSLWRRKTIPVPWRELMQVDSTPGSNLPQALEVHRGRENESQNSPHLNQWIRLHPGDQTNTPDDHFLGTRRQPVHALSHRLQPSTCHPHSLNSWRFAFSTSGLFRE